MITATSDEQACFDALRSGAARLGDLTLAQRTPGCCRLALAFDDQAWPHLPEQYRNRDTLVDWVCHGVHKLPIFEGIDTSWRYGEFLLALEACSPGILAYEKGMFEPTESFPTDGTLDRLLASSPKLIGILPKSRLSYARAMAAVERNGLLLGHLPTAIIDAQLCRIAITNSPCLEYVPEPLLTRELMSLTLGHLDRKDWPPLLEAEAAERLDSDLLNPSVCEKILRANHQCIAYLPAEHLTLEVCRAGLDGRELLGFMLNEYFSHVPEAIRDELQRTADFRYHAQPGKFDDD